MTLDIFLMVFCCCFFLHKLYLLLIINMVLQCLKLLFKFRLFFRERNPFPHIHVTGWEFKALFFSRQTLFKTDALYGVSIIGFNHLASSYVLQGFHWWDIPKLVCLLHTIEKVSLFRKWILSWFIYSTQEEHIREL